MFIVLPLISWISKEEHILPSYLFVFLNIRKTVFQYNWFRLYV